MPNQVMPLSALSMQQLIDTFNNEWHGANANPSRLFLLQLSIEIGRRVLNLPH